MNWMRCMRLAFCELLRTGKNGAAIAALGLGLALDSSGQATDQPQPGKPELTVPVCATPPVIDGNLDDACWQKTSSAKSFYVFGGKGATTDKTEALVICDNAWLYVAFRCVNPLLGKMAQNVFDHDGNITQDDSIEIFVDPGTNGALYYHYLVSYANVTSERKFTQQPSKTYSRDVEWFSPWQSATKVTPEGWTVEVALPLSLFASSSALATMRINLCRNLREPVLSDGKMQIAVRQEESTWAPVVGSSHEPQSFGYLRGLDKVPVKALFLPSIENVTVNPYTTQGGRMTYSVTIALRTDAMVADKVQLTIVDKSYKLLGGKEQAIDHEVLLKGNAREAVTVLVPVEALDSQRELTVFLKDARTKSVLQTIRGVSTKELFPMGRPVTDRNYYTDEAVARLRCSLGLPAEILKESTLVVKTAGGKVLARLKNPRPDTDISLPLEKVSLGETKLTVALVKKKGLWKLLTMGAQDGAVLAEQSLALIKRAPKPGCEVKIDRFNRVILKDGKSVFPFGLLYAGGADERWFERMAQAGYSAVIRWKDLGPGEFKPWMEMAQKYGLMVVDTPLQLNPLMDLIYSNAEMQEAMNKKDTAKVEAMVAAHVKGQWPGFEKGIRDVSAFTNLLGYYNVDEPNFAYTARVPAAKIYYDKFYETDPYRPVWVVYARRIPKDPRVMQICDILGFDVYIHPGWANYYSSNPQYMAFSTRQLKQVADEAGKVAWVVAMAEGLNPARSPRILLPEERNLQAYLALINGAKGIFYFVTSSLAWQTSWDAMSELARQMKVIGPAVVAPEVPQRLKYSPGEFSFNERGFPDVQAALFSNPEGGYVLLAANSVLYPVEATFTVPGLSASKKPVKQLFSEATSAVQGDSFTDRIEAYGVRAYQFELAALPANPLDISVQMKAHKEQTKPMKIYDQEIAAVRKRKNVMPNPLFEIMTVPGVPDYIVPGSGWPLTGNPDALVVLDTVNPWKGKHSLRMKCGISGVFYLPELKAPTSYVLSMYLRGGKDGDMAVFHVPAMVGAPSVRKKAPAFRVTTEWKRYWISGDFLKGDAAEFTLTPCLTYFENGRFHRAPNYNTNNCDYHPVIWMDGMQVEADTEPTEFTTE